MPNVLHCITDTGVGGAGVFLKNLITAMPKNEFRHSVLLPRGSRLLPLLSEAGVEAIPLPVAGDRSFSPSDIPVFRRAFARLSPSLLHTHSCLSARVAAHLFCRVPVLTTRHCTWAAGDTRETRRPPFARAVSALSDLYVATAKAAVRDLLRLSVPRRKIAVIENGVPPIARASREVTDELLMRVHAAPFDFHVVMVGRISHEKGCDILLSAAHILLSTGLPYRFFFVGDGEERAHLSALANAFGLSDRVHFVGFQGDVAPYLSIADVVVNASRGTETSSLALSEAMSLGIPIVASSFGGNPYLVRDGENGLLFPAEDAASLAEAVSLLRRDVALYARLSRTARERYAALFTAERMSRRYLSLYRSLRR